jgi:hypothetical protein
MRILIMALVVGWVTLDASASDLPKATTALTALRRSQVFTTAYVGLGHMATNEVVAFEQVLTTKASSAFLELARQGTAAGRLYGLCGLKALDDPAYPSLRTEMARRHDRVRGAGYIAVRTTVDRVLALRKSRQGGQISDFDRVCGTLIEYASARR